jgi:hypothetical protein
MARGEAEFYVYALTDTGLPETLRVQSRTLRTLRVGSVLVIGDRRRKRTSPTAEALQHQHAVVAALMDRTDALLPARFGSSLGEASLREAIAKREASLVEALALVRGRRQMTIRVFGEREADASADRRLSGTEYLKALQARAHHVPPEVTAIRRAIGGLAAAERVEPGERGLRVTVFHLVATGDLAAYGERAGRLDLLPHQARVSGPWAPFAFAPDLF